MKSRTLRSETKETSREKLLLSAEQLFARYGFNGVSVRDIANAASVNSALVGYYFGGKEGLLSEVYHRHCEPLNREREKLLDSFRANGAVPTLEQILEAFIRPSLKVTTDKDGRSDFTRLRAILSVENSAMLEKLVADNFDESSRIFIDTLLEVMPGANRDDMIWRFHFMLGTVNYTAAGPHRIRSLSEGRCNPLDPDAATDQLIPFLAAGFRTLRIIPISLEEEQATLEIATH